MPTPDSKMRTRLKDLLATIEKTGTKGCQLITLVNRFGVEYGIRPVTVKEYIQMLVNGGYIYEKNYRVYVFVPES